MRKIVQKLRENIFPLILIAITAFLSWKNYQPGTWLSGWDTLHPEFNFLLNFKRVISGVWREEQGLGAVTAHSHMADLPRIFILWVLSFFFPISTLRYLYIFLCLILGPLGVYFFIKHTSVISLASFLGALFYLLNLGVLQHFYVPFEMFPAQFAALPWLFLFATKFLERKRQSDLAVFSLITFLSTPMAYAAQLWYAYFLCFSFYLLILSFLNREFKPAIILLSTTLIVNSYWLLPNLYFLANHAQNVPLATSNQLFSDKAFLASKEFGTLRDTAILRNFLFNWKEHIGNGAIGYLLDEWREYFKNPLVLGIGYAGFIFVVIGVLITLFKKEKFGLAILPAFLISFIFLISMNPPFERIFAILRENFPIFKEGFRFPFTKFSILLMFAYSFYFAIAQKAVLDLIQKILKPSCFLFSAICSLLLVIYMLPAFSGNLVSPSMKIKIPKEYFEMFSWFNKQEKEGRIAHFPIHTLHGWIYYDWGFQGAGFVWFGIKQSFLDRDFDRWSEKNEGYYWEMSHAVYSHNLPLLEKVLEKYQINWILLDENVFAAGSPKALQIEELKEMLTKSEIISPTASFGKLTIYQAKLPFEEKDFVFFAENPLRIESTYKWSHEDRAFLEYGTYYSLPSTKYQVSSIKYHFLFRELFTHNYVKDKNWQVEIKNEFITFKTKLPVEGELIKGDKEEVLLYRDGLERYELEPEIHLHDEKLEVRIPKYNLVSTEKLDLSQTAFNFPYLDHDYAYLLEVESRHISGKECFFYVLNETTKKAELEILLPKSKNWVKSYFILPSKDPYGRGYSLHFDNVSIGKEESISEIGGIKIFPIPYEFLKNLRIQPVSSEVEGRSLLVYSLSFDPGWRLLGVKNAEHVLVNNWANGWLIESSSFKIIYLPQYLEYLGFLLLLIFPLKLLFLKAKDVFVSKPVGKTDVLARELDRRTPDSG